MIFNVLRIKTTCFEAHIIIIQMLCYDVLSTNIFFAITFLNFIKILKLIRLLPHPVMYKLLIQVDVVHMSIRVLQAPRPSQILFTFFFKLRLVQ